MAQRSFRVGLNQIWRADEYVVENSVMKQDIFLRHIADHASPVARIDFTQRHAIYEHFS